MTSSSSQVRVGVRIRPLTHNEKSQGGKSIITSCPINRTVTILNRMFTYDSIYDSSISQSELYDSINNFGSTSATCRNNYDNDVGMLDAFLDGYNSTIMAYGQTGSGKTFTMGSEATSTAVSALSSSSIVGEDDYSQGLIPRFMSDIFSSLERRMKLGCLPNSKSTIDGITNDAHGRDENEQKNTSNNNGAQGQLIDYTVSASFLEIYGEEIYDLFSNDTKQTLPVRDDANGSVVVVGLRERVVKNAEEALNALHLGTLNRTTAQTLMNKKSSRSHAVFTIHLKQTIRDIGVAKEISNNNANIKTSRDRSGNGEYIDVSTTSRFTFVDLAGSERLKKTGAEGERAKEGIKINEGLLALGNVINALGDEERLTRGEKVHVPYRQSKLTRLLQDALGGNSKTLFLACVSPSDTNASETVSTLKYANRARNIKNAPTKNIDASIAEIQRLYSLTNILEKELIKTKFGNVSSTADIVAPEVLADDMNAIGEANNQLLKREDVQNYLALIYEKALELNVSSLSMNIYRPHKPIGHSLSATSINTSQHTQGKATFPMDEINRKPCGDNLDSIDVNPDEDIALLDKILELQHLDQEYDKENKQDQEKLNQVEGELKEQESLLLQLKDNLKAYHNMKERFEAMMIEVQELEAEKATIAKELERVQLDPTKGCSSSIKKRLEKVEANLSRARLEAKKHQQIYKKAEQQAQKVNILEKKIETLKHGKVSLMKKQREAANRYKEITDKKSREILFLKKKERKDGQKLSKLESEIQRHKNHLQRRAEFCEKLSEKLKQTESHLMKILSLRKRDLHERSYVTNQKKVREESRAIDREVPAGFAPDSQEISSLKFLLEKIVTDRASASLLNKEYELKVAEYSDLMRTLVIDMKLMKDAKKRLMESDEEEKCCIQESIQDIEQNVEDTELKIEVVGNDLENLRSRLPNNGKVDTEDEPMNEKFENDAIKMIANLSAPVAKTLLWDILDITTKVEVEKAVLKDTLVRKEAALRSFEQEIQSLTQKIDLMQREQNREQPASFHDSDTIMTSLPVRIKKAEIKQLEAVLAQLENENEKTQCALNEKTESLCKIKEKLTVMEVTMRNKGVEVAETVERTLSSMHNIWKEMGVSEIERENTRQKLESCLEDTCRNLLENTKLKKENIQKEIENLLGALKHIYHALGKGEEFNCIKDSLHPQHHTYQQQLDFLMKEHKKIMPFYSITFNRLASIVDEAKAIGTAMEIPESKLGISLVKVINLNVSQNNAKRRLSTFLTSHTVHPDTSKDKRAKQIKQIEEMMKAIESDEIASESSSQHKSRMQQTSVDSETYLEPNLLAEFFIDECEYELRKLKRLKSETMVSNQISRDCAKALANEMHIQGRELLSLSIHSIKKRMKELPEWWNSQVAEEACRAITSREIIINAGSTYTKHLNIIRDSLESVASGRRALSNCLKHIIEEAHRTLLKIVEGDIDANNAYASFDKALARLPKLSREHIFACLDEMKTLVAAVHDMSQSETEALTVVWQALNVSNSDRGQFWSDVNELAQSAQTISNDEFEAVKKACAEDIEEWIIAAVKDSSKINRKLNDHLFKLSKIHEEVERLRSKQDVKSQIMSLDSELCILSSKLAEFEEKASNKQRLVTKKVNSASLLDEERFRKQMQNNFSSKLHTLVKLLNHWKSMEGKGFDEKMLSEDVNAFIQNPHDCGEWIEKRTAFMHLKTVKQKRSRQVADDEPSNSPEPSKKATNTNVSTSLNRKMTRNSNKIRSIEQKENQQQRYSTILKGGKNRAISSTCASPSSQRQTKLETFTYQKRPSLPEKSDRIGRHVGLSDSRSNDNLTPKKEHKNVIKKTIEDNSSPILPFGQVLVTTPVLKENLRLQNRNLK